MSVVLGSGWRTIAPELPPPDAVLERDPQTALLLEMRDLLEGLRADLLGIPQPAMAQTDLSGIVEALSVLRPNLSSTEIGQAVAAAVGPMIPAPEKVDLTVLGEVSKALEKLDFRMRGTGGGGSLSPDITNRADRQLGIVSVNMRSSSYRAGVSGTLAVPASQNVTAIAAHSTAGGSVTIFGGDSIPILANTQFGDGMDGAPFTGGGDLVFTGTDSYYVRTVPAG